MFIYSHYFTISSLSYHISFQKFLNSSYFNSGRDKFYYFIRVPYHHSMIMHLHYSTLWFVAPSTIKTVLYLSSTSKWDTHVASFASQLTVFTDVPTTSRTLPIDFPPFLQVGKMASMRTALTPSIQTSYHLMTYTAQSTLRTVTTVTEPPCSL
jgi:hypothetical protein